MHDFFNKNHLISCTRNLFIAVMIIMGFSTTYAIAATFQLQSTTVILEEREGRTAFQVTNTGEEPILLISKLADLDDQSMAKNILVDCND